MKVEGTSAQYAEEEIPSGDCEKSKGVESKMADGQQPDLAEGGDGKVCVTHYLYLPRGLYGAIAKVYHS